MLELGAVYVQTEVAKESCAYSPHAYNTNSSAFSICKFPVGVLITLLPLPVGTMETISALASTNRGPGSSALIAADIVKVIPSNIS